MFGQHALGFRPRARSLPHGRKPLPSQRHRSLVVNHRSRIILADGATVAGLHFQGHEMRLRQPRFGHSGQLGNPAADKHAFRILIERLLRGRVDAQRIDARGPRLHLELAEMNARLEIKKVPPQINGRLTPVQPKVVSGKARHHGPHAKVQPSSGPHRAHAGIDHRIPRGPFLPAAETFPCFRRRRKSLTHAVESPGKVLELDARFVFQLLHEVAMPAQPRAETGE